MNRVVGIARFVCALFTGTFAGFLVGVLVLELALRGYDEHVYTQVRHVELVRLDDLASATLVPALLTAALLVALTARGRGRGFWLTTAALALLATVFVISLLVNLPINGDQVGWSVQAPPRDWAGIRDEWQIAHAARTAAAVVAFGCLLAAAMTRPPARGR
ncbi:hypothetical protein Ais01nite_23150 [Asanoa ishikariensis]|uniref:DUF1772 domain-containing protein n=1 Tax=Asanoa ishikariensis TaxID=137265 RepID=A0A1H3R956_9ACTN|nr:anthrone oxygenase family protein [Asanoa ishikariensis]GIF64280.1 hypothetical protein Ais01nite_23150 [Asanoa ishikariensis]SDZ22043.1 protein of unknown function [Asanoa ishikariensis]